MQKANGRTADDWLRQAAADLKAAGKCVKSRETRNPTPFVSSPNLAHGAAGDEMSDIKRFVILLRRP